MLRQHGQSHHTAFDYDPMGRLTQSHTSSPNHIIKQAFYTYDKKGQLTQLNTNTRLGQPTKNVPMGQVHPNQTQGFFNRTHQYYYDKVGRLTEHKLTDHQAHTGHTEVFGFDPASNRVPLPNTKTNTNQDIHNKTKRPTSLISQNKQISYTYDSHGNIKTKTETPIDKQGNQIAQSQNGLVGYRKSIEFSYNSNNELAKTLTLEDTGLTITKTTTQYHYDAFGRRIAKNSKVERLNKLNQNGKLVKYPTTLIHLRKTDKTEHQTTLMLWEGNRQLQEYTDKHIFTTVYDQDSFEPVSRLVQSRNKDCDDLKIYHYHNNHLGTPQELTDKDGNVIWANYEFAWGGSYQRYYKEQTINNIPIDKDHLQPIKFQGQFFDTETSLHYNRFRYYDSDVGMFIQRDPIGLLGGVNVFAYAPNPIHWVDVFGLKGAYMFETTNGTCYVGKGRWGRYLGSTRERAKADQSKTPNNTYDQAVKKGAHISVTSPCSKNISDDDYAEMVEFIAIKVLQNRISKGKYKGCSGGFANQIASPGKTKFNNHAANCTNLTKKIVADAARLYNKFSISTSRR